jgi:hypothetical protein
MKTKNKLWRSVKGRAKILLGREHGVLSTVASPARSGTMWFFKVLTAGPSFCFHELTTHLLLYPSILGMDEQFAGHVARPNPDLSRRAADLPADSGKAMRDLGCHLPNP